MSSSLNRTVKVLHGRFVLGKISDIALFELVTAEFPHQDIQTKPLLHKHGERHRQAIYYAFRMVI
jgi:hypothetical protein